MNDMNKDFLSCQALSVMSVNSVTSWTGEDNITTVIANKGKGKEQV